MLGVTVLKGQEEIEIHASVVISNAGIFNTFQKFLPRHIQDKPGNIFEFKVSDFFPFWLYCLFLTVPMCHSQSSCVSACLEIHSLLSRVRHGMGSFLVFVGLDGTKEELNIVSTNFWMYKDNDLDTLYVLFFSLFRMIDVCYISCI